MRLKEYYKEKCYPLPKNQRSEYADRVYLIYNFGNGLTKIGITKCPSDRIKNLTTQSGNNLHYLLIIELEEDADEPPKMIERTLHEYFKHKRVKGEWFNLSLRDIAEIKDLFWEVIFGHHVIDYLRVVIHEIKYGFPNYELANCG